MEIPHSSTADVETASPPLGTVRTRSKKINKKKEDYLKPGRKRKFSDEERRLRARECRIRWEAKKRREDPGYSAKLYLIRKENKEIGKMTGNEIKGKPGRPRKNPQTDI